MSSSSNDHHSPNPISSKSNKNMNELGIVYRECLKNHAASLGGNARDGCGEFMSTVENRLICSACGCHRNFHRREVDVGINGYYWSTTTGANPMIHHQDMMQCHQSNTGLLMRPVSPFPKAEKMEENKKRRHRTRFTREQKEKMLMFAEKAEWKIHKLDERLVQEFCQEVEINRRVLKVWMHNNKQHYYVRKD